MLEEARGVRRARVVGSWELPSVGAGNHSALHYRAISSSSVVQYYVSPSTPLLPLQPLCVRTQDRERAEVTNGCEIPCVGAGI